MTDNSIQFDLDGCNIDSINFKNSDNSIYTTSKTNISFQPNLTNEPMNLDINKFLNETNADETIHEISQTNDISLIQSINEQHSAVQGAITKRYNSLKIISKWWSESNIYSSLTALNMIKDVTVINDFFNFALIQRDDLSKILINLDHAISLLPHVLNLINSKYEVYCLNACKVALILLRIFNERISILKSNYTEGREERNKKCEMIVEFFNKIFYNSNLDKLRKRRNNLELCQLAACLYTDLEFFLKPYKK